MKYIPNRKLNLLVATFIASLMLGTTAAAKDTYKLRGEKEVGSHMRPVEAELPYPFDKSWGELTDKQRAAFRASYGEGGLKASDKPPFPVKGMEAIYKPIIKGRRNKDTLGGTLFIVAMVDEKGVVENVSVWETPSKEIANVASKVLFDTEFEAPTCDNKPCKMEFPFEFKLRALKNRS